jgi:hypothetical protein
MILIDSGLVSIPIILLLYKESDTYGRTRGIHYCFYLGKYYNGVITARIISNLDGKPHEIAPRFIY